MPGWAWFLLGCWTGAVAGGLAVILGVGARLADRREHPSEEGRREPR